jgi:hypothetical protein
MESISAKVIHVISHRNGYLVARVVPEGGNKRYPVCLKGVCDTTPLKGFTIKAKGTWAIGKTGGDEFVAKEFENVRGFGWAIATLFYAALALALIGLIGTTIQSHPIIGWMEVALVITVAIACLFVSDPIEQAKVNNPDEKITQYFRELEAHNWWGHFEFKGNDEGRKYWNERQTALFNKASGDAVLEPVLAAFKEHHFGNKESRGPKPALSMFVKSESKSLLEMLEEVDQVNTPAIDSAK